MLPAPNQLVFAVFQTPVPSTSVPEEGDDPFGGTTRDVHGIWVLFDSAGNSGGCAKSGGRGFLGPGLAGKGVPDKGGTDPQECIIVY